MAPGRSLVRPRATELFELNDISLRPLRPELDGWLCLYLLLLQGEAGTKALQFHAASLTASYYPTRLRD